MGYHLKDAAEPSPANSEHPLRSPKTHVALRQVSITGQRYYSPEMGRWTRRDPLNESGSRHGVIEQFSAEFSALPRRRLSVAFQPDVQWGADNLLYAFCANVPTVNTEYLGLAPCKHPFWADWCRPCPYGMKQKKVKDSNGCSYPAKLPQPPGGKDDPTGQCSFLDVCNKHDCCYGTCAGAASPITALHPQKIKCDVAFCLGLKRRCRQCARKLPLGERPAFMLKCALWAEAYCGAVSSVFGMRSYHQNQQEHCKPCCCIAWQPWLSL